MKETRTMSEKMKTIEGNEAAAHVAYALSEVAAIYPSPRRAAWGNTVTTGRPMEGRTFSAKS